MSTCLVLGDILASNADGIPLPIDGAHEGGWGPLAHVFTHRRPETFRDTGTQMPFPLASGSARAIRLPPGSPFRTVFVRSILHQPGTVATPLKTGLLREAPPEALSLAGQHGVGELVMSVLWSGSRRKAAAALAVMFDLFHAPRSEDGALTVTVYLLHRHAMKMALDVAQLRAIPIGAQAPISDQVHRASSRRQFS